MGVSPVFRPAVDHFEDCPVCDCVQGIPVVEIGFVYLGISLEKNVHLVVELKVVKSEPLSPPKISVNKKERVKMIVICGLVYENPVISFDR